MIKAARDTHPQAYPNAPSRSQVQVIGVFAVALVSIAMLAGLYLVVSVQAATLGREIQDIQTDILEIQRLNANLETRLAELTSASVMENRAIEMGFSPVTDNDRVYLPVPGYAPRSAVVLAPPPGMAVPPGTEFPAELNQTLFQWLESLVVSANFESAQEPGAPPGQQGP
jgi:cell division protein FtsL